MEYRFYTPKQRLARLEATLKQFEAKHFDAVMNARNAAVAEQLELERTALAQADDLDKAYKRTLAEYEILAEEIEKEAEASENSDPDLHSASPVASASA